MRCVQTLGNNRIPQHRGRADRPRFHRALRRIARHAIASNHLLSAARTSAARRDPGPARQIVSRLRPVTLEIASEAPATSIRLGDRRVLPRACETGRLFGTHFSMANPVGLRSDVLGENPIRWFTKAANSRRDSNPDSKNLADDDVQLAVPQPRPPRPPGESAQCADDEARRARARAVRCSRSRSIDNRGVKIVG